MIAPTLTALAVIFTLSAQAPVILQAVVPDETSNVTEIAEEVVTEVPVFIADTVAEEDVQRDPNPVEVENVEIDAGIDAPAILTPSDPAPQPLPEIQPETRPVQTQLTATEREAILRDAELALAAARTVKGRFTQTNADGSIMTGAFSLRRPGKMRFAYDAPTPILIVSDGVTVAMEDSELETIDRYPLASTPLGLILDEDLSFSADVDVLRVLKNDDKVLIAVEDASGEIEGELTMLFSASSLDLLGWITVNPDLQITRVELSEVETNIRIDPRQFRLEEDEEDER